MNDQKVLLAANNDRDMLDYLHDAFQSEVNVCDQCGHEEPTSTCDSASDLKDYLSHFPTAPQPIYDETSDRALVEKIISKRGWPTEKVNGFYADYRAHHAWSVCLEFAQSRATAGEVGHE